MATHHTVTAWLVNVARKRLPCHAKECVAISDGMNLKEESIRTKKMNRAFFFFFFFYRSGSNK